MGRGTAVGIAVALALALPSAAHAASITTEERASTYGAITTVVFTGDPGADDVSITASVADGARVRLNSSGTLDVGGKCHPAGPREALCDTNDFPPGRLDLGAGDDTVRLSGTWPGSDFHVLGGDGDDTVHGSDQPGGGFPIDFYGDAGEDVLLGGPANEWMMGGAGRDEFHGGGGSDVYKRSPAGRLNPPEEDNLIDGGEDVDTISFWDPPPVSADLTAGTDSLGDQLVSIENVDGADTAYGDDGPNHLSSGRVLIGRGGNDWLEGNASDDVFDGGPGDDVLETGLGRDDARCGPGDDRVVPGPNAPVGAGPHALVRPDCEWVGGVDPRVPRQPTAISAKGVATFALPCWASEPRERVCRLRLIVRGVAKPAQRVVWARVGTTFTVRVKLPRDVRRAMAAGREPAPSYVLQIRSGWTRKELRSFWQVAYRTPAIVTAG